MTGQLMARVRTISQAAFRVHLILEPTGMSRREDQNAVVREWLRQRDELSDAQREVFDVLLQSWRGDIEDCLDAARCV